MIDHKTVSLADQVFEQLENDILSGKYQHGQILTEMKLCAALGVSRTPVREALRRLEQEHIIEESGKGSVVLGITKKDLEDIFTVRARVEGLASAYTAKNATDEQINELKETLELQEFYFEKNDVERIKLMDSKFHQLVYKFSGSATLYDTLLPLHKKVQKYRRVSVSDRKRAGISVEEHKAVYNAIAARDEQLAEKLTIQHIVNAGAHILSECN